MSTTKLRVGRRLGQNAGVELREGQRVPDRGEFDRGIETVHFVELPSRFRPAVKVDLVAALRHQQEFLKGRKVAIQFGLCSAVVVFGARRKNLDQKRWICQSVE